MGMCMFGKEKARYKKREFLMALIGDDMAGMPTNFGFARRMGWDWGLGGGAMKTGATKYLHIFNPYTPKSEHY